MRKVLMELSRRAVGQRGAARGQRPPYLGSIFSGVHRFFFHPDLCYDGDRFLLEQPKRIGFELKIECFVFDFDGTLAELRLDFAQMKQRLNSLAGRYLALPPPQPSLPVLEWLGWLEEEIRKSGLRSEQFRAQALALIAEMEMEAAGRGALFPFTRPLLRKLHAKGAKTAIITRNSEAAVRVVFPEVSELCPAFFSRDHVISPKPDPAHAIYALEFLCAVPRTAIMIGDHPLDIQTGKAAGMLTAGVCSGSGSRNELLAAGADWVADDCQELMSRLLGW